MTKLLSLKKELQQLVDPEKADFLPQFFKAYPGGYGEGDLFIGVKVPDQRRVVKKYVQQLSLPEVIQLLQEPIHEYRQTALLLLVELYQQAENAAEEEKIVRLYLEYTEHINNWDLVDCSAEKILGAYLFTRTKDTLYLLARSNDLWEQRIAVIATFYFIKQGFFSDTLQIAEILLQHPHDLIHKAVGWMLREVGKRDYQVEYDFLKRHYQVMPRTMLRYAIEKFPPAVRQQFLKGTI
ncbi:MAG TPA: DNA alkylation repair protein [Oscillospiraceae bacterium]|nr:DNA alkylation repair protein [Oscillospiraceae bacterium]